MLGFRSRYLLSVEARAFYEGVKVIVGLPADAFSSGPFGKGRRAVFTPAYQSFRAVCGRLLAAGIDFTVRGDGKISVPLPG